MSQKKEDIYLSLEDSYAIYKVSQLLEKMGLYI